MLLFMALVYLLNLCTDDGGPHHYLPPAGHGGSVDQPVATTAPAAHGEARHG